jgi:hypothetical protein
VETDHDPGTHELILRLKNYWQEQGVKFNPGATPSEITSFESRHHVRLPRDLRHFYLTVNRMDNDKADSDNFTFLPLSSVKSVAEELVNLRGTPDYSQIGAILPDASRWFVIVDFLVTSAVYAISLAAAEANPVIRIDDGHSYRVVATSFSSFLERYMANSFVLLSDSTV